MDPNREITDAHIKTFIRCYNSSEESIRKYEMYGPSNPLWSDCLENQEIKECEYSEDGICYMLTCKCKEVDEDGIKSKDYYTGMCNECKESLPNKSLVWRHPLLNGGFIGCFCKSHYRLCIAKEEEDFHNLCDIMEIIRDKHPIVECFKTDDNITIIDEESEYI